MKIKKYFVSVLALVVVLAIPFLVSAQASVDNLPSNTNIPDPEGGLYAVLVATMMYLLAVLTILGVIGFIISGIIYITAGGAGKAEAAKKWLVFTIVGMIVGLIGYIIIRLIDALLRAQVPI